MIKEEIYPSIFGANIGRLEEDVSKLKDLNIEYLHVDLMDGNFVENIAFGPSQIKDLKQKLPYKFDVHMMTSIPEKFIPTLLDLGVEAISIHVESQCHLMKNIQMIKARNAKAGIVLNPGTPLSSIDEVLDEIDYVLLMSVNPGVGGQTFYKPTLDKIKRLKRKIEDRNVLIQVDGGVNDKNIQKCRDAGADLFVVGSYMFSGDVKENFKLLKGES